MGAAGRRRARVLGASWACLEGPRGAAVFAVPPHPCGTEVQQRKIRHAQQAAGACPVLALAHAYGPVDDFERRFAIALAASDHGVLVNRYAYLADEKLDAMQRVIAATE